MTEKAGQDGGGGSLVHQLLVRKGSFQNTDLEQVISCLKFIPVSDSPVTRCSTQSILSPGRELDAFGVEVHSCPETCRPIYMY